MFGELPCEAMESSTSGINKILANFSSISSAAQSCPTLCDPMDWSMPGFPVHHQLLELAQTHVHRVTDAIQASHPLSYPFPPDECNYAVVRTFFGIVFLWEWNENWPFPVLWPLMSFPDLLAFWVQHFHSIIFQDLKYFNWNSSTSTSFVSRHVS